MVRSVISLDLWNTIIVSNPRNIESLSSIISTKVKMPMSQISRIMCEINSKYDDVAIKTGVATSSKDRIDALSKRLAKKADVSFLEQIIADTLFENLPSFINLESIYRLTQKLTKLNIGIIICSNTGFGSAQIMRRIICLLGISEILGNEICYFSEEIGYAKPSKKFFKSVEGKNQIIIAHCGDHIVADGCAKLAKGIPILFDANNKYPNFVGNKVACVDEIPSIIKPKSADSLTFFYTK